MLTQTPSVLRSRGDESVNKAERAVVAAILRHTDCMADAISCAEMITRSEETAFQVPQRVTQAWRAAGRVCCNKYFILLMYISYETG